MIKYFKYLIFKLSLHFKGIRFFKTDIVPSNAEFRKAEFKTIEDQSIQFLFYRETFQDIIFKRGKIYKENLHCYIIQTKFDDSIFDDVKRFNNLKYIFNINGLLDIDENEICEALLNVYLDFIKHEITIQKK